jgi:DNA-binding SARP family transcriptional activator/TolB-like protein
LDGLLGQHSRAALFVYLAIERRVPRESLLALFWPESDDENARHALRQSLYQLRKAVGVDWVESRAHELLVTDDVRTDALELTAAVDRGRFAEAIELYRGPFLDGVHLVDLTGWESWVDGHRAQYARAFRKASRGLIEERRAAGDLAGAIEAGERWTARDPTDGEAQHRLIESLAAAGERAEAIRQFEAYTRGLAPDGLQPLDETVQLVERLRSESAPLPASRSSSVAVQDAPVAVDVEPSQVPHAPVGVRQSSGASWSSRRTAKMTVGVVLIVLFGVFVWGLRNNNRASSSPLPSGTVVAVLPFTVHGGPSERYLGNGMVDLLTSALDGAASLRPVDTRAIFSAIADAGAAAVDSRLGDRVAARLGATKYVIGDVVAAGGQVQIDAGVYDPGAGCASRFAWGGWVGRLAGCPPNAAIARVSASGSADSVFELVDRIATRLLVALGDSTADQLLHTAALTSSSLPAFKAYLDGEGLMRAGQFEKAADAYLAAVALDTTFALAYYRLGLAREWAPLPGEDTAAAAASRHSARLSARDRARLRAFREWRTGNAAEAERAYRSILARYPEDVDAWFQLGEILFHHGPLFGRAIAESEEAWRRVLSYEPRSLFAITHLARIALLAGRNGTLDSLLKPFTRTELETDRRLAELVLLRAVSRGDSATVQNMLGYVRQWERLAVWRVAVFLTAFSPDPAAMRPVLATLAANVPPSAERADLFWFTSLLDLSSGRANASRLALAKAAESERDVPPERRRAFQDVTEWFAATLPLPYADSTLARAHREASERPTFPEGRPAFESGIGIGSPIQLEPVRQYTLGVLASRLSDPAAAARAAANLHRLAEVAGSTTLTRDLDRGLRARLAWQKARSEEALALLDSLESKDSQGDVAAIPFVSRANERYLRGEVLASLGRNEEALRWFASLGDGSVTEVPFRAISHLRQAEIYHRLGKRDEAARHSSLAVALWRGADSMFRQSADSVQRLANGTR